MSAGPAFESIAAHDKGTGAILLRYAAGIEPVEITDVMVNFTVAPAASEDLTITLTRTNVGNFLLYSTDPSADGLTDIACFSNIELLLNQGDVLTLDFANSGGRTFTAHITGKRYLTN